MDLLSLHLLRGQSLSLARWLLGQNTETVLKVRGYGQMSSTFNQF